MAEGEPESNRRGPAARFHLGDWLIQPQLGALSKENLTRRLERKPIEVLSLLALAAPDPVTREDLLAAVWPGVFASDQSLTRCIGALRKALGDDPSKPRYIQTIPKVGYRLVAPVSFVDREKTSEVVLGGVGREPSGVAGRQPGSGEDWWSRCQDHVYVYGKDGRFLAANPAGAAALGTAPEQLQGKHWRELDLPGDAMLQMEELAKTCVEEDRTTVGKVNHVSIFGSQVFEYVLIPLHPRQPQDRPMVLVLVRAVNG